MMDLDGFEAINDTFGHQVGDIALQITGQRFQRCVRNGDTLARIGGDEFAVPLPELADQQAPALVAQRIIGSLASLLDLGTQTLRLSTSIGIAVWPDHAGNADALLAAADTAMYRAKRAGGQSVLLGDRTIRRDHCAAAAAGLECGACRSASRRSTISTCIWLSRSITSPRR